MWNGNVLMGTRCLSSQVTSAYSAMCGIQRESKKIISIILFFEFNYTFTIRCET